jgi:hypothetical protein
MAGLTQEKLKAVGRNLAKRDLQRAASQPKLNENKGASDGGIIGRGASPRKKGVYRGA